MLIILKFYQLSVHEMRQFFRSHVCSDICSKLNLPLSMTPSSATELELDGFFPSGPVRSRRNPTGSFLTSNWQKSGGIRQNHKFIQ
jgi:hypothetical protein